MHSALLLSCAGKRLMLDAGSTWKGELKRLHPDWIAITHAHPDHAFALEEGTDVPVYVSAQSRDLLDKYPVGRFRVFEPDVELRLGPFRVLPYAVIHSIRAPAVGFRVCAAGTVLAYNPDIISIDRERAVLTGVDVYIGDAATLTRPLVRRRGNALFGHTTVRAQLNWCKRYGIGRAYIVHCGKQLVEMKPDLLQQRVDELAGPEINATVAHDGMRVRFAKKPEHKRHVG